MYSFGLILWEMLSLRRPFEGLNRKEFVQTVIKGGQRPPLQQEWSGALRELMRRCWDEDMDTRPGTLILFLLFVFRFFCLNLPKTTCLVVVCPSMTELFSALSFAVHVFACPTRILNKKRSKFWLSRV